MKKLKHRSNMYKRWQYRLKIRLKHKEYWEKFLENDLNLTNEGKGCV